MPASGSGARPRHPLHHGADAVVLTDVAEEVDAQRRRPVSMLAFRAPSPSPREDAAHLPRAGARPTRRRSPVLSVRSAVGRGSPIRPVDPPTRPSGLWPASWRRRSVRIWHEVAKVQAGQGRVEPAVVRDRLPEEALERGLIGRDVDEADARERPPRCRRTSGRSAAWRGSRGRTRQQGYQRAMSTSSKPHHPSIH